MTHLLIFSSVLFSSFLALAAPHPHAIVLGDNIEENIAALRAIVQSDETTESTSPKFDTYHVKHYHFPQSAEQIKVTDTVFRHYIGSQEAFDQILETRMLKAGTLSYCTGRDRFSSEYYQNCKGVFFTESSNSAKSVGVPASNFYIDFTFTDDIPALLLNDYTRIYLVPLVPGASVSISIIKHGKG